MYATEVRRRALALLEHGSSVRSVSMATGINRVAGPLAGRQVIVDRQPGDFARGLFHSDGYRGMNPVRRMSPDGERRYEYPRYLFTNESADILRFCGQALDRLGVAWRLARPDVISVAKRDAVARLDEFVGPKY